MKFPVELRFPIFPYFTTIASAGRSRDKKKQSCDDLDRAFYAGAPKGQRKWGRYPLCSRASLGGRRTTTHCLVPYRGKTLLLLWAFRAARCSLTRTSQPNLPHQTQRSLAFTAPMCTMGAPVHGAALRRHAATPRRGTLPTGGAGYARRAATQRDAMRRDASHGRDNRGRGRLSDSRRSNGAGPTI